jgi:hypothetical protein
MKNREQRAKLISTPPLFEFDLGQKAKSHRGTCSKKRHCRRERQDSSVPNEKKCVRASQLIQVSGYLSKSDFNGVALIFKISRIG